MAAPFRRGLVRLSPHWTLRPTPPSAERTYTGSKYGRCFRDAAMVSWPFSQRAFKKDCSSVPLLPHDRSTAGGGGVSKVSPDVSPLAGDNLPLSPAPLLRRLDYPLTRQSKDFFRPGGQYELKGGSFCRRPLPQPRFVFSIWAREARCPHSPSMGHPPFDPFPRARLCYTRQI